MTVHMTAASKEKQTSNMEVDNNSDNGVEEEEIEGMKIYSDGGGSENQHNTKTIILYIAEIINLECGKFKVGYIIRDIWPANQMCPYANFSWLALSGIPESAQKKVAQEWESHVE